MPTGRWPSNLVLQHGPACRKIGTKKVKGKQDRGLEQTEARSWKNESLAGINRVGYADEDGLETVADWECSPGCPVKALDEQSLDGGMHAAGNKKVSRVCSTKGVFQGGWKPVLENPDFHGDSGGASRFFNTFSSEAEVRNHLIRLVLPPDGKVLDPFAANGMEMPDLYDALVAQSPAGVGLQELARLLTDGFGRLRPGAHAVVRVAPGQLWDTARVLENAGFVVRDTIVCLRDRSADRDAFLASLTPTQRGTFERLWPSLVGNKPASELWWLARKPFEGTVVENVLKNGTGAINIDACRVGYKDASDQASAIPGGKARGRVFDNVRTLANGTVALRAEFVADNSKGRWPANLTLQHGPGCERVGTKKIKGGNDPRGRDGCTHTTGQFVEGGGFRDNYASQLSGYGNGDGTETVESWKCLPSCPVRALDVQSGECRSAGQYPTTYTNGLGYHFKKSAQGPLYDDMGGASRFFNTFSSEAELLNHLVRLVLPPGGRVLDPFATDG